LRERASGRLRGGLPPGTSSGRGLLTPTFEGATSRAGRTMYKSCSPRQMVNNHGCGWRLPDDRGDVRRPGPPLHDAGVLRPRPPVCRGHPKCRGGTSLARKRNVGRGEGSPTATRPKVLDGKLLPPARNNCGHLQPRRTWSATRRPQGDKAQVLASSRSNRLGRPGSTPSAAPRVNRDRVVSAADVAKHALATGSKAFMGPGWLEIDNVRDIPAREPRRLMGCRQHMAPGRGLPCRHGGGLGDVGARAAGVSIAIHTQHQQRRSRVGPPLVARAPPKRCSGHRHPRRSRHNQGVLLRGGQRTNRKPARPCVLRCRTRPASCLLLYICAT